MGATHAHVTKYIRSACTCLEAALQVLVDAHHRAAVVELAAVVGRREDRYEAAVGEELVAVLDDLVRAHDEVEVVLLEEAAHHVGAEGVRDAAVVLRPAQQAGVRHIDRPRDALQVVGRLDVGREAAVDAEDLAVDNCRERQRVEELLLGVRGLEG
eukprot:scaffold40561_cov72-Phaeocystis_antarctica.AAC.4